VKFQTTLQRAFFFFDYCEFAWDLELGIWDLPLA
jgi:hypothetical protein